MLKLAAEDEEDLAVISAQMQDALILASDMRYLKKRHQFALMASRFAWDAQPTTERRPTGLHVNTVLSAERKGFGRVGDDTILSLLAITFAAAEQGAGVITLDFSGGFSLRLHVEGIDVQMSDMGPGWLSAHTPSHDA